MSSSLSGNHTILEQTLGIQEVVSRQICTELGDLALTGASQDDLDMLARLSNTAEEIASLMDQIFEGINAVPTEPTETKLTDREGPDTQSASDSKATEASSPDLSINFTDRERRMLDVMASTEETEWFSCRDFDFSDIEFTTDGARNTAFRQLVGKFVSIGLVEDNGAPTKARRYKRTLDYTNEVTVDLEGSTEQDSLETSQLTEITFDGFLLSEREEQILRSILVSVDADLNRWFKQSDVDLTTIQFPSSSARNQAFSKLTKALRAKGFLADNGKDRGARRYRLTESLVSTIVAPDSVLGHGEEHEEMNPQLDTPIADESQLTTKPSPLAVIDPAPTERPEKVILAEQRRAMRFAQRSLEIVVNLMRDEPSGKVKLSVAAKKLGRAAEITESEARGVINGLAANGHFYKNGHDKGFRLLSLEAPVKQTGQQELHREQPLRTCKQKFIWDDETLRAAAKIFNALLGLKHVQQGKTLKQIVDIVEKSSDPAVDARAIVRELERRKFLMLEQKATTRNSGHSRRTPQLLVSIVNQDVNDRMKADMSNILIELSSTQE